MSKKESVEVTVKIPKRLLDVLEQEEYFGWRINDFFVASIIRSISCEVNSMDIDDVRALEAKYGKGFDVVYEAEVDGLKVLENETIS